MNFKKWFNINVRHSDNDKRQIFERGWDACKQEILKIIEDEIDNGNLSITKAARKIKEEI